MVVFEQCAPTATDAMIAGAAVDHKFVPTIADALNAETAADRKCVSTGVNVPVVETAAACLSAPMDASVSVVETVVVHRCVHVGDSASNAGLVTLLGRSGAALIPVYSALLVQRRVRVDPSNLSSAAARRISLTILRCCLPYPGTRVCAGIASAKSTSTTASPSDTQVPRVVRPRSMKGSPIPLPQLPAAVVV